MDKKEGKTNRLWDVRQEKTERTRISHKSLVIRVKCPFMFRYVPSEISVKR